MLALYQGAGIFGVAKGRVERAGALATTAVVLALATAVLSDWRVPGIWIAPAPWPESPSRDPTRGVGRHHEFDRIRPRDLSPPVAPGGPGVQDLGADRALVPPAARPPDRVGRGAGTLALRRGRAQRVRRAGGRGALHRDDLPDGRPRARGRPSRLRPRHRAETQAAPERDPVEIPGLAAPQGPPVRPLSRLRPRAGEPPGPLSRG